MCEPFIPRTSFILSSYQKVGEVPVIPIVDDCSGPMSRQLCCHVVPRHGPINVRKPETFGQKSSAKAPEEERSEEHQRLSN